MPTQSSQIKASRNWEKNNPEKARHDSARRQARRYINSFADNDELNELEKWIAIKRENIK